MTSALRILPVWPLNGLVQPRLWLRSALLLLAIASPALVRAQFQPPTPEELKMTADPKAPGTAAVYLNVEEITDDERHFLSTYARIKVLQEKGKELATVEIPYWHGSFKIDDIQARTIHSDGTVIPLTGKPEDLLIVKKGSAQVDQKVFNLPSVEVGSILEYRYKIRYDDNLYSSPLWEIQKPYFVHKAHYGFTPFAAFRHNSGGLATTRTLVDAKGNAASRLVWWTILPSGTELKTDPTGRYSVDLTDIPPIPDEEWMPPIKSVLYKVLFYYASSWNNTDFWISEAKSWSKDVDHFAEPSKSLKEAVAALIAPGDSDLVKAKKLYKAVQALDNTDFSRKKADAELKRLKLKVAKRAEDTWTQKSGSSQDIALLYLAMLRAAGLTAYNARVVDRERGTFDPGYLDFDQLDDDVVILNTGGNEIFLDPGEKMCPFQSMHWRHSGASGIRQSSEGRAILSTPLLPYNGNATVRTGDMALDSHGAVTGTLRIVMTGQPALHWRQTALRNDLDEVKKQFDQELESMVPDGVEAHIDHFLGLDDPDINLLAIVNVHGALGSATSKRLILPGFFFSTRSHAPFVGEERRMELVDMHYADRVTDEVVYHLPLGLTLEGAPQDTKIPWVDHALFLTKSISAPGQVTIVRSLARAFTFAKQDEYQDLRAFYQKIAAADQAQLVLTTAAPPKGN